MIVLKQAKNQAAFLFVCFGLLAPYSAFAVTSIYTCSDLQKMSLKLNDQYVLANDIDCTGFSFMPVGIFTGSLDGAGHKISNLTMDIRTSNYAGLFSVTQSATIQNLRLENVVPKVSSPIGIGALVGMAQDTKIINVSTFNTLTVPMTISGDYLVESNTQTAMPTVSFGGLIGILRNHSSLVSGASSIDLTAGTGVTVGGLVGSLIEGSVISNSYATGHVSGISVLGGLVGYLKNSSITMSYATGKVDSSITSPSMTNYYNMGGLVGHIDYTDQTTNPPVVITNSYATGDIGVNYTWSDQHIESIGGLIGKIHDANNNSCAYSNKSAPKNTVPKIENNFASGNVKGTNYVGGFVGSADAVYFLNNYSVGNISSIYLYHVGGFFGGIGTSPYCVYLDSNYWDIETSEISSSNFKAIGKTTAQMYQQNNYVSWDFNSIWSIDEGSNYPCLKGLSCKKYTVIKSIVK